MRVLVTGAAGFIGRHVCEALLGAGHAVTMNDLTWGNDVCDPGWGVPEGCEVVVHLAGLAAVGPSLERPAEWMRVNVQGTATVLEASRRAGARRVVYAASGTYYDPRGRQPSVETDAPGPITPYGWSKYLGERLCEMYGQVYGLSTVALRLFNPYGPGMSRANRMGEWLDLRRAGQVITVSGSPEQYRDYCAIEDVARAFVLAVSADVTGPINIGSGRPVKIRDLVAMLGPHVFEDAGWQAPGTWADIALAKRVLGWEPLVSFEEGMRRVLEHEDSPVR